jgi:hypothetical protein
MTQEREPGAEAKYRGQSSTETVNQPCPPNKLVACSRMTAGRHPLCLAVPDGDAGCGSSASPLVTVTIIQFGRARDEASVEWDGHCCRPGYCRARVGANERHPDETLGRPVSGIGADGVDGVAYAEPPGKGAPSSRNAPRER